ncbi:MAG: phoU 2 [Bacteroidetes bacterium]|nr:phoU 2 [Bacteroidota bacterium]
MERRFEHELESLKTSLVKMGSVAEDAICSAIRSLLSKDHALAQKVIDTDDRINSLEIEIDNAILDLLALQQPVASDLRFILASQKINNDLERIGDHAVNIAESVQSLEQFPDVQPVEEIPRMVEITRTMLKEVLDSFIHPDPHAALSVLKRDDEIDELNRGVTRKVIELVRKDPQAIEGALAQVRISRNLERVADLATNIAEEVLFYTQARVVKHRAEERGEPSREKPNG